jgi:hypothetical protein
MGESFGEEKWEVWAGGSVKSLWMIFSRSRPHQFGATGAARTRRAPSVNFESRNRYREQHRSKRNTNLHRILPQIGECEAQIAMIQNIDLPLVLWPALNFATAMQPRLKPVRRSWSLLYR